MHGQDPTVIVIGAGFSGTALAAALLRRGIPMRVVLINRFGRPGRGVAYGTRFEAHLLNVAAGQMSAFPEDPEHFLRFVRESDPDVAAGSFVSRRVYGEYLERVLEDARREAVPGAILEPLRAEVVRIDVLADGAGAEVSLADSRSLRGDVVVLALGNYSPADPPIDDPDFYRSEHYVRDPWVPGALDVIEPGETVLIVGTGLTMMDIALDLHRRGVATPIHAVSPRGLLPHPHVPAVNRPEPEPPALVPSAVAPTIRAYVRKFRAQLAARNAMGATWREVVGSIRAQTPALWQALPLTERARFLRHVRPFWEVHRHRAAPETAAAIAARVEAGDLEVVAGRIVGYEVAPGGVRVSMRRRGGAGHRTIEVTRVVNCTGPDTDIRRIHDPLIRSLVDEGHLRPDPLGLGIESTEDGRVTDRHGRASSVVFLVGPLLKARVWEGTAVPELREHAAKLARTIAGLAARSCVTRS